MAGFPVNAIDTTGAGDSFVGALLCSVANDPSIFQVHPEILESGWILSYFVLVTKCCAINLCFLMIIAGWRKTQRGFNLCKCVWRNLHDSERSHSGTPHAIRRPSTHSSVQSQIEREREKCLPCVSGRVIIHCLHDFMFLLLQSQDKIFLLAYQWHNDTIFLDITICFHNKLSREKLVLVSNQQEFS